MLKFSKTENQKNIELIKIVSLLVHAAKIDENYTNKERELIINFINNFSKEAKQNIKSSEILEEAEKYFNQRTAASNQTSTASAEWKEASVEVDTKPIDEEIDDDDDESDDDF